jgi:endogenous inhibitor of DNA gyrase (YacG/DUF329 family)
MSYEESPFPEECDYCGTPLDEEVRYPTTTVDRKNRDIHIFTFCSEECKEEWLNEHIEGSNQI